MKHGFTMIELLVTLTIIALLAGIAIPVANSMLERSREAENTSNLRQIGTALLSYANDHNNLFPTAGSSIAYGQTDNQTGAKSWQEQLEDAGYIGDRSVFQFPKSPRDNAEIKSGRKGYFLGSRAAYADTQTFGPVNLLYIQSPSSYILGGQVFNQDFNDEDADRDNYTQEPAFGGGTSDSTVVLLYADGRVQGAKKFDPLTMTTRYTPPGESNAF